MAKMKSENKVITVDENSIDFYLKDGYDHVEFDEATKSYKVVKPAKGKVVPYEELLKAQAEIEALKAEIAQLKSAKK